MRIIYAVLAVAAISIVWVATTGPRMKHQLAQCEAGSQVRECMQAHGWRFNQHLVSCDNASARELGCYETGFPWDPRR